MTIDVLAEIYMDALLQNRAYVEFFAPPDDPVCTRLVRNQPYNSPVWVVGRRDNGEWIVRMDMKELRRVVDQAKQAFKAEDPNAL